MVTLILIFSFVLGLVFGSFANVLIYRLPRGLSIISPPSFCPNCEKKIPFYCNIPILSYIFLFGKCKFCKSKIAIRYPLVELLVGVLFWFATYSFIPTSPPPLIIILETIFLYIFLFFISVLIFIDLEHQILPDKLTLPGIFLGLISSFIAEWSSPIESLLGAALGALVPSILIGIYSLKKIEAMGWGDVKLMAMIGAFLGWKGALLTFLIGSLLGTVVGGLYILLVTKDRRTPLPFGTFLGIGAIISLFWGTFLFDWYYGVSNWSP